MPHLACSLLLLALPPVACAAQADDKALLHAVHGFLYEQAQSLGDEILVEVYSPSARLPACESPQPFLTREKQAPLGRVSVGVRCGADGRQVRYLQAEIGVMGTYPVLASDVGAGEAINLDHLTERHGNLADLPQRALRDPDTIIGQMTTRPLRAGQPLQAHQLRTLPLVERRQSVTVEARGSGFRVSREGEALEPGGLGDRVRVRFDTREIVTAEVTGEATLTVDF